MDFKTVIGRDVLLEQLRKNKERYVESYKVLVDIFKKEADKYQKEFAEFVNKKAEGTLTDEDNQPYPPTLSEDRTETYDTYIEMISLHDPRVGRQDTVTIEIDDKTFANLYMDKWNWMDSHIHALTIWADSYEDADASLAAYMG